jgi:uncharacterized membrane protein
MIAAPPFHALIVHLPVVLIPTAAILTLVVLTRSNLLTRFATTLWVLTGIGLVSTIVATETGETLENKFASTGMAIPQTLRDHAALGDQARIFILGLFIAVSALWYISRRSPLWARPKLDISLKVMSGILALLAMLWTYRTGHSGASSVWAN